jgi:hypothetical protein
MISVDHDRSSLYRQMQAHAVNWMTNYKIKHFGLDTTVKGRLFSVVAVDYHNRTYAIQIFLNKKEIDEGRVAMLQSVGKFTRLFAMVPDKDSVRWYAADKMPYEVGVLKDCPETWKKATASRCGRWLRTNNAIPLQFLIDSINRRNQENLVEAADRAGKRKGTNTDRMAVESLRKRLAEALLEVASARDKYTCETSKLSACLRLLNFSSSREMLRIIEAFGSTMHMIRVEKTDKYSTDIEAKGYSGKAFEEVCKHVLEKATERDVICSTCTRAKKQIYASIGWRSLNVECSGCKKIDGHGEVVKNMNRAHFQAIKRQAFAERQIKRA